MHPYISRPIYGLTCRTLVETAVDHVGSELHIRVDSVVDSFDPISIVHCEFGIVRRLDRLGNDAIDNAQSIKDELGAVRCAIGNELVLVVEVIVECRAIVTAVRLRPEIKRFVGHLAVQLRESA